MENKNKLGFIAPIKMILKLTCTLILLAFCAYSKASENSKQNSTQSVECALNDNYLVTENRIIKKEFIAQRKLLQSHATSLLELKTDIGKIDQTLFKADQILNSLVLPDQKIIAHSIWLADVMLVALFILQILAIPVLRHRLQKTIQDNPSNTTTDESENAMPNNDDLIKHSIQSLNKKWGVTGAKSTDENGLGTNSKIQRIESFSMGSDTINIALNEDLELARNILSKTTLNPSFSSSKAKIKGIEKIYNQISVKIPPTKVDLITKIQKNRLLTKII